MERSVDGMDEQNIFRRIDPANRPIQLIMGLGLAQICVFLFAEHRESRADPEIRFFYKSYSRLSPVFYGGVLVAVLALISVNAYFQGPLLRTVDLLTLSLGLAQLGVFLFSRRKREAV